MAHMAIKPRHLFYFGLFRATICSFYFHLFVFIQFPADGTNKVVVVVVVVVVVLLPLVQR